MKKRHRMWLDQFLLNCSLLNKSEHTIINYRADLTKFIRWYEAYSSASLSRAHGAIISEYKDYLAKGGPLKKTQAKAQRASFFKKLQKAIATLKWTRRKNEGLALPPQRPLATASRRRHLSTLKNFFEFLKQTYEDHSKLFAKNPVKPKIHGIRLKDIDIQHTAMLSRKDWKDINEVVFQVRDRLMLNLLYWGGLRLGELTHLKVQDFSSSAQTLKFQRKGGDLHLLKLQKNEVIFPLLDTYLAQRQGDSPHLFVNKRGRPLSQKTLYNIITRLFRKAHCSKNLTPHSFRKACATNLYIRHKDLLFVRDYLNHKDAQVTQTYIDKKTLYAKSDKVASS